MQDLAHLISVIVSWTKTVWAWIPNILGWFRRSKDVVQQVTDIAESVADPKVSIFDQITFKIWPRARLTYWLADEEVVVYVDKFEQKDKFKLQYRELITGKMVLVNGANPLNYRLEQLSPTDAIVATEIQQNQRYT